MDEEHMHQRAYREASAMARSSAFGVSFCTKIQVSLQPSCGKACSCNKIGDRAVWEHKLVQSLQADEKFYLRSTTHFDRFNSASVLLWTAVLQLVKYRN
jgi:hypothetical protein